MDKTSYLGEFVDGDAVKTDEREEGEISLSPDIAGCRIDLALVFQHTRVCVRAYVHVFVLRVYAVSCAAFVLKRLRQLARVFVRVCAVCMCMRCMCAFTSAVCV